jgi:hypothetical protein
MQPEIEQLRQAGDWPRIRQLLTEFTPQQNWAQACYAREGSYNSYLRDLDMLHNWAIEQDDLALSIHCSLIASSIRSMSGNIDGELLVQLIKIGTSKGKWSIEAALQHIEQQPSEAIEKLEALIAAGIPLPWERVLGIIDLHSDLYDKDQLFGSYMQIYPLIPVEFQESILLRLAESLDQETTEAHVIELKDFIAQLPTTWQNYFWQRIIDFEFTIFSIAAMLKYLPEQWAAPLAQTYQELLQQILSNITPHQLDQTQIRTILSLFDLLAPEQQSLSYWGILFEEVLASEMHIFAYLPQHELQALVKILCKDPKTIQTKTQSGKRNSRARLFNSFALYQQLPDPQLLQKIIDTLSLIPSYFHPGNLNRVPAAAYHAFAGHVLSKAQATPDDLRLAEFLVALLPHVPERRPHIIQAIQQALPYQNNACRIQLASTIAPYLEPSQQTDIIEQAWQASQIINSQHKQTILQLTLLTYLPADEQTHLSNQLFQQIQQTSDPEEQTLALYLLAQQKPQLLDQIYQHLITSNTLHDTAAYFLPLLQTPQQQALTQRLFEEYLANPKDKDSRFFRYLTPKQLQQLFDQTIQHNNNEQQYQIMAGLSSSPHFAHQQLLPYIAKLHKAEQKIRLLLQILENTAPDQQTPFKQTLDQIILTLNDSEIYQLAYLKHLKLQHILDTTQLQAQLDLKIHQIKHLAITHPVDAQVSQGIWHYVTQHAWTLDQLFENHYIFHHCAPHLSQQQIQTLLEHMLEQYHPSAFPRLVPYLDQTQLQTLLQLHPNTDLYNTAQQHHNILQQADHYQNLLTLLQQTQSADWFWLHQLNSIAPHLQNNDYHNLLNSFLQQPPADNPLPSGYPFIQDTIEQLRQKNLLNLQIMHQLSKYTASQQRSASFEILHHSLPAYLETLQPNQQQQLASQINHSIEQVCTCWP